MSDYYDEPDDGPEPDDDNPVMMATLRKAARDGAKARKQAAALERELAFVKAGVPLGDTPLSRLFITQHDGPVEAEAVAAAWAELVPPPPPAPVDEYGYPIEPAGPEVAFLPGETDSTKARNELASLGASPPASWSPDPREVALAAGRKVVDDGGEEGEGLAVHFDHLVRAAMQGDRRVVVNAPPARRM